jgi:hypothetical protein
MSTAKVLHVLICYSALISLCTADTLRVLIRHAPPLTFVEGDGKAPYGLLIDLLPVLFRLSNVTLQWEYVVMPQVRMD